MPFKSKKEKLQLSDADREMLQRISKAPSEEFRRVCARVFFFIMLTDWYSKDRRHSGYNCA